MKRGNDVKVPDEGMMHAKMRITRLEGGILSMMSG